MQAKLFRKGRYGRLSLRGDGKQKLAPSKDYSHLPNSAIEISATGAKLYPNPPFPAETLRPEQKCSVTLFYRLPGGFVLS